MFNPPKQPNQAQPNNQRQGTGFTNLNKVIGINQGNKLGAAIGQGIGGQVQQTKQAVDQSQQDFNQAASKSRYDTDENKQKVQTVINDPTQIDDSQRQDIKTFRSGKYEGPTELQNQQLGNQAASVQSLSNLGGSAGGRAALLQRFVGNADYNQGKQKLDSLLLGQSGGQELAQARRDASGLVQDYNKASDSAKQTADLYANQNKQFAKDVDTSITGKQSQITDAINQRLSGYEQLDAQKKGAFDALSNQLQSGQIGADEALSTLSGDALLNPEQKKNLLNVYAKSLQNGVGVDQALKNALSYQQAQNLTFMGTAEEQELKNINALSGLMEKGDVHDIANKGDAYQAGTLTFDQDAASRNIDANKKLLSNMLLNINTNRDDLASAGITGNYLQSIGVDRGILENTNSYSPLALSGQVYNRLASIASQGNAGAGGIMFQQGGGVMGTNPITNQVDQLLKTDPNAVYKPKMAADYQGSYSDAVRNNATSNLSNINASASQAAIEKQNAQQAQAANLAKFQALRNSLGLTDLGDDIYSSQAGGALDQNLQTRLNVLGNVAASSYGGVGGTADEKANILAQIRAITG